MQVIIRADASDTIGTGHIMRCLTLADALKAAYQKAGKPVSLRFVARKVLPPLADRIAAAGYPIDLLPALEGRAEEMTLWSAKQQQEDAQHTLAVAASGPTCIVVDHYSLSRPWHKAARRKAAAVVVIDDLANREYSADLIFDQSFRDDDDRYKALNDCADAKHLQGPEYCLISSKFTAQAPETVTLPSRPPVKLLINFGGSDQTALTRRVLEALANINAASTLCITVVGGIGQSPLDTKRQHLAFESLTFLPFADDLPTLLHGADFVIGAGGVSALERCVMGCVTLLFILADNQRAFAHRLVAEGGAFAALEHNEPALCETLERFLSLSSEQYTSLSNRARQICPGNGADIAAKNIMTILGDRS